MVGKPSSADVLGELTRAIRGRPMRASSGELGPESNRDAHHVRSGQRFILADLDGPREVRHIWLTIASLDRRYPRTLVLRIFYDGAKTPSVETPIGDFFAVTDPKTGRRRSHDFKYRPDYWSSVAFWYQKGIAKSQWPLPPAEQRLLPEVWVEPSRLVRKCRASPWLTPQRRYNRTCNLKRFFYVRQPAEPRPDEEAAKGDGPFLQPGARGEEVGPPLRHLHPRRQPPQLDARAQGQGRYRRLAGPRLLPGPRRQVRRAHRGKDGLPDARSSSSSGSTPSEPSWAGTRSGAAAPRLPPPSTRVSFLSSSWATRRSCSVRTPVRSKIRQDSAEGELAL